MRNLKIPSLLSLIVLFSMSAYSSYGQNTIPGAEAAGKWDITIQTPNGSQPAWLEIEKSGISALVGRFVGPGGSARPISEIVYQPSDKTYHFTIPPQWSSRETDPEFQFTYNDNKLDGWTTGAGGEKLQWTGVRAPGLVREHAPVWGEPIDLIDKNLSAWILADNNEFVVENDVMINKESGGNIVTKQTFDDFKLHLEFKYPEGSNSGVYLRGRYEVQIADNYNEEPESHFIGGVYGFIDPVVNAAHKANQWQTYDITLIGRRVTVVLNGQTVIKDRPIPGITGGALDSNEAEPGPIMLQGDHGAVSFRNMSIIPSVK